MGFELYSELERLYASDKNPRIVISVPWLPSRALISEHAAAVYDHVRNRNEVARSRFHSDRTSDNLAAMAAASRFYQHAMMVQLYIKDFFFCNPPQLFDEHPVELSPALPQVSAPPTTTGIINPDSEPTVPARPILVFQFLPPDELTAISVEAILLHEHIAENYSAALNRYHDVQTPENSEAKDNAYQVFKKSQLLHKFLSMLVGSASD